MKHQKKQKNGKFFDPSKMVSSMLKAIHCDLAWGISRSTSPECTFVLKKQMIDLPKKFVDPADEQDELEAQAFNKFLDLRRVLAALEDPVLPPLKRSLYGDNQQRVLRVARNLLHEVLGDLSEEDWFLRCKHSQGTSLGLRFSQTNLEDKWRYPLTTTQRADHVMNRYLSWDYQMSQAVEDFNSAINNGSCRYRVVRGSRATTVPKNQTARRMIAVEPTVNMFLQQGLMLLMYDKLKAIGLDMASQQTLHQQLALESSVTGKNATIDWSSASDRIRTSLVKLLFPASWFTAIDLVRSPEMELNGLWYDLPMVGTMGNATTFPIETLIFWSIGVAVIHCSTGTFSSFPKWEVYGQVQVFGDDCIIPIEYAHQFIDACKSVGFSVNEEKSFMTREDRFRESCGGDFLHFRNVRTYNIGSPVDARLSSLEPWLYTITNGVLKKYISYFGHLTYLYDKAFLRWLARTFRRNDIKIKFVPMDYPDDAGVKIDADSKRLLRHYSFIPSTIRRNRHGQVAFQFCSFRYQRLERVQGSKVALRSDPLHYATGLKLNPSPPHDYTVKRIGGYVVARGLKTFDV